MIDWFGVIAATTWIIGLAVLVATLGFARLNRDESLRQTLRERTYRRALIIGGGLFALGMALGVTTWYEHLGWALVTILLLWEAIPLWRHR